MIWAFRKRSPSRPQEPQTSTPIPIVTERSAINRLLQKGAPDCIALFGASWFRPNKRIAEQLARRAGRHALATAAIDIDEAPDLADRYSVTAVPSLLLLREGQVISRRLGEINETALDDWIAVAQAAP